MKFLSLLLLLALMQNPLQVLNAQEEDYPEETWSEEAPVEGTPYIEEESMPEEMPVYDEASDY